MSSSSQPRHLIDPFLRPMIAELENHIMQNALIQYLQPFTNASVSRLMEAFGQDEQNKLELVVKLGELVRADRLHAKLDLVDMVRVSARLFSDHISLWMSVLVQAVQAIIPDSRTVLYKEALAAGAKVQGTSRKTLLHMQL
jgi:hypothetical protein